MYVLHGGDHFTVAWVPLPAKERFEARVAPRASVERCSAHSNHKTASVDGAVLIRPVFNHP